MTTIRFSDSLDHAIVAYLAKRYCQSPSRPLGRTILQKLGYLAKAAGIPLSLSFEIHHYGPFSVELFSVTGDLIADKAISDTSSDPATSSFVPASACEKLLKQHKAHLNRYTRVLDKIIELFRGMSPTQLELLTTIHYIFCSKAVTRRPSRESVVEQVFSIKDGKFSRDSISSTFDALKNAGLLSWNPRGQPR